MEFIFIIIVILVVVGVWAIKNSQETFITPNGEERPQVYFKKQFFLTIAEYKFFEIIKKIIGEEYVIFPQVNLASILNVRVNKYNTYKYRNPVNRKILDFVVFEKKYISPVLVIELDDSSHNSIDRKQRDELVDSVLLEAKIGIMHVPSQYNYNIQELTTHITDALNDLKESKREGK